MHKPGNGVLLLCGENQQAEDYDCHLGALGKAPSNWLKLNIDRASCGNPGRAGGVLRDSAGNWVKGFARSIGSTTSIIA